MNYKVPFVSIDKQFKNNSKDGFGKYYEGDTIYEGGWKNGKQHGVGTYTSASGKTK